MDNGSLDHLSDLLRPLGWSQRLRRRQVNNINTTRPLTTTLLAHLDLPSRSQPLHRLADNIPQTWLIDFPRLKTLALVCTIVSQTYLCLTRCVGGEGSTNIINDSTDNDDFLSRERALLGDDADQFSTPHDNNVRATVEDDDDDLLGGGGGGGGSGGADMGAFESSFPSIDNGNEVYHSASTISTTVPDCSHIPNR